MCFRRPEICWNAIRCVVEILDSHFSRSEDAGIGQRTICYRKPEGPNLVVVVNEVNTLQPEGWILCRLSLNTNDRVFVGVDPDSASGEILVGGPRLNRNYVSQAAANVFGTGYFKRIVLRSDPGSLAKTRSSGVDFGFE